MGGTITAIYEHGVLRPLEPLSLPEHARVQIEIVQQISLGEERRRVRQALVEAGMMRPRIATAAARSISATELGAAAERMGRSTSLSDLIIAEREGR